jgi:O-antigen/teichoic acid export membrane protein
MMAPGASESTGIIGGRGRRILHASSWSLVAKVAAAANLFIAVPFVLKALGPVEFGVWATLVAFTTFSTFLDFGLGNGAMNLVAAAYGRGDANEVAAIWREASSLLLKIAGALILAFAIAWPFVPWHVLLGLPASDNGTARQAIGVVALAVALSIPLGLATRVQLGLGRGQVAFRCQAVGNVLALAAVLLLARAQAGVVALTVGAVATPLLGALANTWSVARNPEVHRSVEALVDVRRRIRRSIGTEGILFFYLQLSAALVSTLDLPLISAIRGAEDAGTYAIVQRLFSVVALSLGLLWAPLWPVYRHALASGHHDWVQRTLARTIAFAVVFASIAAFVLVLGFDWIIRLWVHRELFVAGTLVFGMAAWSIVDATGSAIATFLNAASIMRYQLIVATLFVASCVAGKVWVLRHAGMEWMPWVTLTTYLVMYLVPTGMLLPRLLDSALRRHY